tara:strand:- start:485 stop:631 length:147 start_codon:yes stop_codon:yes gene_type:complete
MQHCEPESVSTNHLIYMVSPLPVAPEEALSCNGLLLNQSIKESGSGDA